MFTLTPVQVWQQVLGSGREIIRAGQILAVMALMQERGWTIAELAERSKVSESHLSDFLNVKTCLSWHYAWRVARAFGLKLSVLDQRAEQEVAAKVSP
ncbi:MAG: helix-turn-helix domain-containing protein [Prosthecobacter sp.]|uniref:helix-turn-helix domain-containing protein n=1 Tax=Prosthecobacter sp. TaxID=1965333 RepID=UPI003900A57D